MISPVSEGPKIERDVALAGIPVMVSKKTLGRMGAPVNFQSNVMAVSSGGKSLWKKALLGIYRFHPTNLNVEGRATQ